jgi:hypothetical protein
VGFLKCRPFVGGGFVAFEGEKRVGEGGLSLGPPHSSPSFLPLHSFPPFAEGEAAGDPRWPAYNLVFINYENIISRCNTKASNGITRVR